MTLYSAVTGALLATVDGSRFDVVRSAATTALAARCLADPAADTLLIFGSDEKAAAHVKALLGTFRLTRVRIVDPAGGAHELAGQLRETFGVDVRAAEVSAAAMQDSQIIVLSEPASGLHRTIHGALVSPGTFVAAVGGTSSERQLDDALLSRSTCVVTDDSDEAMRNAADFFLAPEDLQKSINAIDLAFLLSAGGAAFARKPDDITVYKAVGMGLQDVALARAVWLKTAEAALCAR